MPYNLLTLDLLEEIEQLDETAQSEWLFLERSEEFPGYWQVTGLTGAWFLDFEDLVGNYRLLTPVGLEPFLMRCKEGGYHPVFVENPFDIIKEYERLQEPPPVSLTSSLDNTIQGFLPWQVVGFNKLIKSPLPGGYFVWCTGAGKTAMIAAAIQYHKFDLTMIVVKSHNKIDTQRKLQSLAGIESIVIDGPINKRYDKYEAVELGLIAGDGPYVCITNYEKFRDDRDVFKTLFKDRDLLLFWDEMPAKLSNPETQLYKGVKKALYESFYSKPRAKSMRHWALSATPIENNPGDVWGCMNIMCPGLLGTQKEFRAKYVASYNFWNEPRLWHNLDHLEAKLSQVTHRVSKDDPKVASMFPEVIESPTYIDWHPKHRGIYDKLTGKATDLIDELTDANILAMIQIMQMMCDAPSMIKASAAHREKFNEFLVRMEQGPYHLPLGSDIATILLDAIDPKQLSDVGHTKLATLKEIITEKHPNDKIVVHSTWAEYIFPVWEYWLKEWGLSYVVYGGTTRQKQIALDLFRDDPDIQVFISGDAGADSIDITESSVGINYNIPWKWTTLQQRQGRRDRVNTTFDTIYTYSLIMPNSVDERKLAVCNKKRGYHEAIFDGKTTEEAISASLTREELVYLITGITD